MDRPLSRTDLDAAGWGMTPREAFPLPSRRPALTLLRSALASGPVLVTGDAGVGKTWLWRKLETEAAATHGWVGVDLTPANDSADLYRLIGHALGLNLAASTAAARLALADFLSDRQADGHRLTLVIEEAHNLAVDVWEDVRVLINRLDRPGGFAGLVLVGQTPLLRRLGTRPLAALEARLAARVHLGPIDADEARELLVRLRPDRVWSPDEIEIRHRDAAGNPRRLLRELGPPERLAPRPVAVERALPGLGVELAPVHVPIVDPVPAPVVDRPRPIAANPLLGPPRPPLRVEENLIEVGWEPEEPAELDEAPHKLNNVAGAPAGEEAIQDHYAALQAWREWSENQAKQATSAVPVQPDAVSEQDSVEGDEADDDGADEGILADRPNLWADGQQGFAPFGQLFSRMAQQQREPE
jgi:general secretion pathway protein A